MARLTGRQGDVNFVACQIPKQAKRVPMRPFALGEVTGHSHRVVEADLEKCEMYEMEGRTFLKVSAEGGVSIQHEDHDPTAEISKLPAGWAGEVIIAQEYNEEEGWRRVVD